MLASVTSDRQRLQAELQARWGPALAVVCTGVDGHPQSLWDTERAAVAHAIPRRQREFAAGRAAARAAMRQSGQFECAIPAAGDRSPVWPNDWIGSIAHSNRLCVVIGGRRQHWTALGIDVEEEARVEPSLWPLILQPGELLALASLDECSGKRLATRVFSAKEAYYKWQYPRTRQLLDFHDVSIRLHPDGSTFDVVAGTAGSTTEAANLATGQQFIFDGHIVSCVVQSAHPANFVLETA